MGVDLKVMVSHFRERRGEILPTATVRFDRDATLFEQLAHGASRPLVHPLADGLTVGSYEDDGLRYTAVDRYGNRLTFTTPTDLAALSVPTDVAPWNRAVLAFLLALPPDTPIILYWC